MTFMTLPRRRLLVVEDEKLMQRLLTAELEDYGFDIATAESVTEAKKEVVRFDPDIALIDIGLKGGISGVHLGHFLAIKHPDVAQIFLSAMHDVSDKKAESLGIPAGAGFVSKHAISDTAHLVAVINEVVGGRTGIQPAEGVIQAAVEALGVKGRRVMELLAAGYSNHYIASELSVTQKTVEYYVDLGYKALGVDTSSERNPRVDASLRYQQLSPPDASQSAAAEAEDAEPS
jgi:DNA-binding NarL/FixJ family response regulator